MKRRYRGVRLLAAALIAASSWAQRPPNSTGPGCRIDPAAPSVGAEVPLEYFAPFPSTSDPRLVGPVQLMRSGTLNVEAETITLPLYRGVLTGTNQNVWYIVTDTTDIANAEGLGINPAPKLIYAATGRGVRNATLMKDGLLVFDSGTVNFAPERRVVPGAAPNLFPPNVAEPGAVGDANYTPLVRIANAGGHIYNMPIISFGTTDEQINAPAGNPNYRLVHDKVMSLNIANRTVTLRLSPGFSFAKPVLYLSMDTSSALTATLEEATVAPALNDIETGDDDSLYSAVERIFLFTNGAMGCQNPQRQGLNAALADGGRSPMNVLGGIPTVATDYSPLWDVNLGEWTAAAIQNQYRSRLIEEFQILNFARDGFLTGPGGERYGSIGAIVNCPIVFRFL